MPISGLIAAVLAGLLGGAHCLAMCGGFMTALAGPGQRAVQPVATLHPARALARRQLPYNLGRITTYTALGAVAGGAGGAALAAGDWLAIQRVLYVVANLFLLILAFLIMSNGKGIAAPQRIGAALFARVLPAVRPLMARDDALARYAIGAIWGLVPCGLVYAMLPIALFAGGALQGAALMLAFGLGTLPNLLAAGFVLARAGTWLNMRALRFATAVLLAGFGVVGIGRALFGSLTTLQGAFCF
jgi:sulfite exporter TauE/SafE